MACRGDRNNLAAHPDIVMVRMKQRHRIAFDGCIVFVKLSA